MRWLWWFAFALLLGCESPDERIPVRGRLVMADGSPVAGVAVTLRKGKGAVTAADENYVLDTTSTAPDGSFEVLAGLESNRITFPKLEFGEEDAFLLVAELCGDRLAQLDAYEMPDLTLWAAQLTVDDALVLEWAPAPTPVGFTARYVVAASTWQQPLFLLDTTSHTMTIDPRFAQDFATSPYQVYTYTTTTTYTNPLRRLWYEHANVAVEHDVVIPTSRGAVCNVNNVDYPELSLCGVTDGLASGGWASVLEVELDNDALIAAVSLTDVVGEPPAYPVMRPGGVDVDVSADGETWQPFASVEIPANNVWGWSGIVEPKTPMLGRWVRIAIREWTELYIGEMGVWAE